MKVGTKGHYGVRAMVALARAYGSGPMPLSGIAAQEDLSAAYLEQLMIQLRRAGLVEGSRGAHGGYVLTHEPSQMTVGQVVRALDGPVDLVNCASEVEDPNCCEKESNCPSRVVWQRMKESIALVLDSTTLADLCRESIPLAGKGGLNG
ncbi:MAG: Rrf2 family transcriptional regulator [Dehalococcoidia bacterium]|nr:Rrf2 family transcriptional regulator [Dehalococcoidia bacterium]